MYFFSYSDEFVLDQSYLWLVRKYKWASKYQYDLRRANQMDTRNAISDSINILLSNLFGKQDDYQSLLMPSFEEARKAIVDHKTDQRSDVNKGIVTTNWWKKGSKKDGN